MAGSSSVQLADHVGHQVEVTGTFGSPSASPTSGTTTGTTGSPSGTGTSSADAGTPGQHAARTVDESVGVEHEQRHVVQRDFGPDAVGELPAVGRGRSGCRACAAPGCKGEGTCDTMSTTSTCGLRRCRSAADCGHAADAGTRVDGGTRRRTDGTGCSAVSVQSPPPFAGIATIRVKPSAAAAACTSRSRFSSGRRARRSTTSGDRCRTSRAS